MKMLKLHVLSLAIIFSFFLIALPSTETVAQCTNWTGQSNQGNQAAIDCSWRTFNPGAGSYTYLDVDLKKTYRVERNGTSGSFVPYITVFERTSSGWNSVGGPATSVQWTANYTGATNHIIVVSRNTSCAGWNGTSSSLRYREVGTEGYWKGGHSSNWITNKNWECRAIPGAGTETVIPGPCSGCNNPVISNDADVLCIKVESSAGANLEVQGSSEILTIHGAVTGNCN